MSEITITIPLSLLSGAESLTPEGISATLAGAEQYKAAKEIAENKVRGIAGDIRRIGQGMQAVLDSDTNIMDKFKALRELALKAQQLGSMYQ